MVLYNPPVEEFEIGQFESENGSTCRNGNKHSIATLGISIRVNGTIELGSIRVIDDLPELGSIRVS